MDLRSLVEQYQWNESYTEQYRYHSGERVDSYSQQTVGMWVGSLDYDNWAKAYQDRVTLYEKEFVNQGWDVYVGLNDHLESSDEFYYFNFGRNPYFNSSKYYFMDIVWKNS